MASLPAVPPPLLTTRSGRVRTARRLVRRASRAEHRLFLAEGPQAVREALVREGCVREVFATVRAHDTYGALRAVADVPWHLVEATALDSLAATVQPQGLVAVCRFVDLPLADLLDPLPRLVAVAIDVRDPGNAGTVVRCADAAGAGGVVLAGSSVDPYNGKAVRASAGSVFHLPLAVQPDIGEVVAALRGAGLTLLAATGSGEVDLDDAADDGLLGAPTAWLFGNEAHGLADAVADAADHRVRIPLHGRAESLNLATASAVCLYASARAQRPPRGGRSPGEDHDRS